MRVRAGRVRVVLVGAIVSLLALAAHASAATFTVNSTADRVDANPGDGHCRAANGKCTLRAAVMEANAGPPSHDTVRLPSGRYDLTIPGAGADASQGDLNVADDLTILGGGQGSTIVHQTVHDRVLSLDLGSVSLRASNLTLSGGRSSDPDDSGGGISIPDGGSVALKHATVANNRVRSSTGAVQGGAITNYGTLKLIDSLVKGNLARSTSATGGAAGGGVWSQPPSGTLLVKRSLIADNSATAPFSTTGGAGGGLLTLGSSTIVDSTVRGNLADATGGGVFQTGSDTLTLVGSTLSDNLATQGGGLALYGPVDVTNSTLSGNAAMITPTSSGGAVYWNSGTLSLTLTTIAGNQAPSGEVSGIAIPAADLQMQGTILKNPGKDCSSALGGSSLGYSIDAGGSCGLGGPGDLSHTNPLLGPLADNGGPTKTQALLNHSPAIDLVPHSACPPPTVDQRHVARPQGPRCDSGAYEKRQP